nr:GAP family protein [Mycobacterium alsense]
MYVVCLGIGMLFDPVRIGIAAVLMSRRQAIAGLLAFWVGGMIAGVAVGIAVLVLLHDIALVAIEAAAATINDVRSAVIILAGPRLQITIGVLALVGLAILLARERARMRAPVTVGGGGASDGSREPRESALAMRLSTTIHGMLESGFVWPAFVLGLLSTFPPIEGPMALTFIMGSRAAAGTQFSAFILFTLLVLVFIEVPLISYLAAPHKTQAAMLQMNSWITAHRRQIIATLLAVTGVVSLVQGIICL